MAKMTYIDIVGKSYPMSFSLMASKQIAAKYGSIEKMLAGLQSEEGTTAQAIEDIGYVVGLLISQGCAFKNYFEKDVPPPENAPIIDGEWTPLPQEALELAIGMQDIEEVMMKVSECITGDKERETEEVPVKGKGKNTDATQE